GPHSAALLELGYQRGEVADVLEEKARRGSLERGAGEGSPESRHRGDARRVPGSDVVRRVAQEDRLRRRVAEQLEREPNGLGVGLVPLARVEPDQLIEKGIELEKPYRAVRALV